MLNELLADLAVAPRLPGAACRGHAGLFDRTVREHGRAKDVNAARAEALALCRTCPALASCRVWLDSLPAHLRPTGVVAGQVVAEDKTSGFQRERAERHERIAKLAAAGMSNYEIAAATGHSKSTVRRALAAIPNPTKSTAGTTA